MVETDKENSREEPRLSRLDYVFRDWLWLLRRMGAGRPQWDWRRHVLKVGACRDQHHRSGGMRGSLKTDPELGDGLDVAP